MERSLFLSQGKQKRVESYGLSITKSSLEEFQALFFEKIKEEVLDSLSTLNKELKEKLYFLGSFGLGQPCLFSDLDLCFIGELSEEKKSQLESVLRKNFRKHSLLVASKVEELTSITNFKTLVSLRSITPLFSTQECLKKRVEELVITPKLEHIKNSVKHETLKRRLRFGDEAGRLLFSFKTVSGGILDLKTLDLYNLKESKKEFFFYKVRALNQILYKKDQFHVTHASKLSQLMNSTSELAFFDAIYLKLKETKVKIDKVLLNKNNWLTEGFKSLGLIISKSESTEFLNRIHSLWSRVNSPKYHTYTVGEHLKACFLEMVLLIEKDGETQNLTKEEKEVLLWASLFHDLGKDQTEVPHSIQGAVYAGEFGRLCGWTGARIASVSWLVREHLTLARHAFKMDPFNPKLIERLSLKGVSGRRAVKLYFLTVADTKATNPKSWSEFKKDILSAVLKQILGFEDKFKSELMSLVDPKLGFLVESLGLKEISLIPHEFLLKDLKEDLEEGFKVYQKKNEDTLNQDFWLRFYCTNDHIGLASEILTSLKPLGVYVDLALFSSGFKTPVVYNWLKIESSLSIKALEKRLALLSKTKNTGLERAKSMLIDSVKNKEQSDKVFKSIQVRYKTSNYAVISFKGGDQSGLLLAAVVMLAEASMSILWGHAVTWGRDAEDVFGVSYNEESDWDFLKV